MSTQEIVLNRHAPPILIKIIRTNDLKAIPVLIPLTHEVAEEKSALPAKMTCYVPSHDVKATIRHLIKDNEVLSAIPLTIAVQPPLGEYEVLLLLWYITEKPAGLTRQNHCTALELKNGDQWLFMAQDKDAEGSTFEKSAERAFITLFDNLERFGFAFQNLLHTWFFIPQITGYINQEERYQVFNKYRRKKFITQSDPARPGSFFPASTGIGCNNTAVGASAVAFKSSNPAAARMMDNERQVPAYQYPRQESIEAPLFSRGMCLRLQTSAMIFVSGTASILNAKTVFENDVEGQTRQTIENIQDLLRQNAVRQKLAPQVDIMESVTYATVYIKRAQDYPVVKMVCRRYFGDIPILYVKADICRDNLLVEIECIAGIRLT